MPHSFDFDTVESRLFALHHVALGSRAFCARFLVDRVAGDAREHTWWQYVGHLKPLVSSTLIDAAVKIRMLQDFAKHEAGELDVQAMQAEAVIDLRIGYNARTLASVPLRDSCNKIIHATEAKLIWREDYADETKFEYWTGEYHLIGSEMSGAPWEIALNVPDWCTAMIRFNREFQEKIDWAHVVKWDE